jgi:uncharacterized protein (DUF427 family)
MAKATWNGVTLAESEDIRVVEGNLYFPKASLDLAHVRESSTHTTCGWKGVASYYDVLAAGEVNKDACWYYPTPKAGAEEVQDRVAFWKGVEVSR